MPAAIGYITEGDLYRWGYIVTGAGVAATRVVFLNLLGQRFVLQRLAAGGVKG